MDESVSERMPVPGPKMLVSAGFGVQLVVGFAADEPEQTTGPRMAKPLRSIVTSPAVAATSMPVASALGRIRSLVSL